MTRVLTADIRLDGIEIDGRLHLYPIPLAELDALFDEEAIAYKGSARAGAGATWNWRTSGVRATHTDGRHAQSVTFDLDCVAHEVRIDGRPFGEEFGPTGPTYPNRDFGNGFILARRTEPGPDQHVKAITVEQKAPRRTKPQSAKVKRVVPAAPEMSVDAAEFVDLNFKLLVVQALMYDKELLKPEFSLYDFLGEVDGREIDIRTEGHEPIPEALAYFAALRIPRALLSEIVELEQDGGNDVYGQIAPLWDGEGDCFDIADFRDVAMLPNLRSIMLTGVDDETLEALREKGIDAQLL